MPPLYKQCLFPALGAMLVALLCTRAHAAEDSPEPTAEPSPESTAAPLLSIADVIPPGERHDGLDIPQFTDEGILKTRIRASSGTLIDAEKFQLEKMEIIFCNDQGEPDFQIDIPLAHFHLPTEILESETPPVIYGEKYILLGENLWFDAARGVGKMRGRTQIVVFDLNHQPPQ